MHSLVWSKEGQGPYWGVPLITAIQMCSPVCLTGSSYLEITEYVLKSTSWLKLNSPSAFLRQSPRPNTHTHDCRHFTAQVHNQHALFLSRIRSSTTLSSALICQDIPYVPGRNTSHTQRVGSCVLSVFCRVCMCTHTLLAISRQPVLKMYLWIAFMPLRVLKLFFSVRCLCSQTGSRKTVGQCVWL